MKRLLYGLLTLPIFFNILLTFWLPLHGDVFYNQDSARDFLLIQEIVEREPLTLIGPRTLGISGLFHGPLWLYMNVPAYILGHGNPSVFGLYWAILYVISILLVWYVAKKLFDPLTALLSALLYSSIFASPLHNFNNTFGAVLLFPLFFLCTTYYFHSRKLPFLVLSFLLLGLLIQFQMAFGIPLLILQILLLSYFILRKKIFSHFISFFVILIPLSTFILFELRHHFLQSISLYTYLTSRTSEASQIFTFDFFSSRFFLITQQNVGLLTGGNFIVSGLLILFLLFSYWNIIRLKRTIHTFAYFLFIFFYIGYWIVTYPYSGQFWIWYHWEFASVFVIIFCSFHSRNKWLFFILYILCFGFSMQSHFASFIKIREQFIGKDHYSWVSFLEGTKSIYEQTNGDFGYYVFEDDMLGYRSRYAVEYQKNLHGGNPSSNTKRPLTYIFIASSHDPAWWKKTQVRIEGTPQKSVSLISPYRIEEYRLSADELQIPSDPNLIDTMHFR